MQTNKETWCKVEEHWFLQKKISFEVEVGTAIFWHIKILVSSIVFFGTFGFDHNNAYGTSGFATIRVIKIRKPLRNNNKIIWCDRYYYAVELTCEWQFFFAISFGQSDKEKTTEARIGDERFFFGFKNIAKSS